MIKYIYPELPTNFRPNLEPIEYDSKCDLCPLSGISEGEQLVKNVCLRPKFTSKEEGGVLILTGAPTQKDDESGRILTGSVGDLLFKTVKDHYSGPVTYDYTVRCYGMGKKVLKPNPFDACSGYLAYTIEKVKPSRIIVLGGRAALGFLGRGIDMMSVRNGYGWYETDYDTIPVFLVMHPRDAISNEFLKTFFIRDMDKALNRDMSNELEQAEKNWTMPIQYVHGYEGAKECLEEVKNSEWFSWDTETVGTQFDNDFEVICLALYCKGSDRVWLFPEESMKDPECIGILKEILENPKYRDIAQNHKYDSLSMYCAYGIECKGILLDTMHAKALLDSDSRKGLDHLQELVGMGGGKEAAEQAIVDIAKQCKKKNATEEELSAIGRRDLVEKVRTLPKKEYGAYIYGLIPKDILYSYCCRDAYSCSLIAEHLLERFEKTKVVKRAWDLVVRDMCEYYPEIEKWGMLIGEDVINKFSKKLHEKKEGLLEYFQQFGEDFNPSSSPQIGKLLYEDLKLTPPHTTPKGKPSTDVKALNKLRNEHPVVNKILQLRDVDKLINNYADGMKSSIRADGRIHSSYRYTGARSGRLSCDIHTIPRGSDETSKLARSVFIAPEGSKIIQIDYSSIELRIGAALSQDKKMMQVFIDGDDYHMRTAKMISKQAWGIDDWDSLSKEEKKKYRSLSKSTTFGLMYGMGDKKLGESIGGTAKEAATIRNAIMGNFNTFAAWVQESIDSSMRTGYCHNVWEGEPIRRRQLFNLKSPDMMSKSTARNASFNSRIQGTSNEYCVKSVCELIKWIKETGAPVKIIATIHDSIIFEVVDGFIVELVQKAKEVMENWESYGVPTTVDVEIGQSWGSLKPYKEEEWV